MKRSFLLLGSLFAFLGVALGAFGAHGLKNIISPALLSSFETGVRYQIYHSLAIILAGLYADQSPMVKTAGLFFSAGIFLFSGSLYLLVLSGNSYFGAITPLGGVCFLVGWAILIFSSFKIKKEN